jgi:hypothetical protein
LQKRFGAPIHAELRKEDLEFLRGLDAAGIKGAFELIEVVARSDRVLLDEVF